jgi:hypothetical protein
MNQLSSELTPELEEYSTHTPRSQCTRIRSRSSHGVKQERDSTSRCYSRDKQHQMLSRKSRQNQQKGPQN